MRRSKERVLVGDTFDLFAEPSPEAKPATQPASLSVVGSPTADSQPEPPRRVIPPDRHRMLEQLFGDRKAIFKAMRDDERLALATAVDVLVTSRQQAYVAAAAAQPADAFGWMVCNPELAAATAALNAFLLDLNSIPMAV
jgi:hypothetical protein